MILLLELMIIIYLKFLTCTYLLYVFSFDYYDGVTSCAHFKIEIYNYALSILLEYSVYIFYLLECSLLHLQFAFPQD